MIVDKPRGKYREHFSPETCKAKDISRNLHEFIIDRNLELSLVAIGCDGTVVNTGRVPGVIRKLELMLDRPLQWFHIIKYLLINEGAKNFHFLLVLSSLYLTTSEKEVTMPVFSNNAYFSHPGNGLLNAVYVKRVRCSTHIEHSTLETWL